MKIDIKRKELEAIENLARYILCITDDIDIVLPVRNGRKAICKTLGIEYKLSDECKP